MRVWYQIEANEDGRRNIRGKLSEGKFLVRKNNEHLYVCIGISHQETLKNIVRDFSGRLLRLDGPPTDIKDRITPTQDEYTVPCGEGPFYDPRLVSVHISQCKKCADIRGIPITKRRTPKSRSRVIAKLIPGQSLTLTGVLASIEYIHDQLFAEVDKLSNLLCDLRRFQDKKNEYIEKLAEAKKIRAATKLVWNEIDKSLTEND